jgi:hypothetical protein
MCYFITVSVPKSKEEIFKSNIPRGLSIIECSNPSIIEYLPKSYSPYYLITGMCSCDLFSEESNEEDLQKTEHKLIKKYRKKGWSENKIKRAISQSLSDSTSNISKAGLRDDAKMLLSDIAVKVGKIKIIVHMYSGDQNAERFDIQEGIKVSSSDFLKNNPVKRTDQMFSIVT